MTYFYTEFLIDTYIYEIEKWKKIYIYIYHFYNVTRKILESSIENAMNEKWKHSRSSRANSMSLFLSVSKVVSKVSFSSSSLEASFRNCSTCTSIWSNRPTNLSFGFGSRCSCCCCSLSILLLDRSRLLSSLSSLSAVSPFLVSEDYRNLEDLPWPNVDADTRARASLARKSLARSDIWRQNLRIWASRFTCFTCRAWRNVSLSRWTDDVYGECILFVYAKYRPHSLPNGANQRW